MVAFLNPRAKSLDEVKVVDLNLTCNKLASDDPKFAERIKANKEAIVLDVLEELGYQIRSVILRPGEIIDPKIYGEYVVTATWPFLEGKFEFNIQSTRDCGISIERSDFYPRISQRFSEATCMYPSILSGFDNDGAVFFISKNTVQEVGEENVRKASKEP